ncbi:MAG: phage holin family protein [Firmicutes bacterium]|nr:phage holin family protein [Bacillota bacterium]
MHGLLLRWLVNAIALLLTTFLVDGVELSGFGSALFASAILGIVNAMIRPALLFLTLPFNILTLGLFTFVINALMLLLTASVVSGFNITGFWAAFVGAIVLSIVSAIITALVTD